MRSDQNSDMERRLQDLLEADLRRSVTPTDSDAILANMGRHDQEGSGRHVRSWVVPVVGTVLIATVATGLSLRLFHIGEVAGGPSPSASLGGVDQTPSASSSLPGYSSSPTPSGPSAWHLVQLELPAELKGYLVNGVSHDGAIALVQEPQAAQSVHLIVSPADVRDLVVPGHTVGAPIGSSLSPDARFVLLSELNQAWVYDIGSKGYVSLPNPPGSTGAAFWISDARHLLALTGSRASHEFGGTTNTQLWRFDLDSLAYSRLGTRHDGLDVYPTSDGGAVILIDTSPAHDNTGWIFQRVLPDGSDHALYEMGADNPPPSAWAVAPDGQSVAFTTEGLEVLLYDGSTAQPRQIAVGYIRDFSPDSVLLRIVQQDGVVQAIDRSGLVVISLAGPATGWVADQ